MNIALKLPQLAKKHPTRVAVVAPLGKTAPFTYESLSFEELDQLSVKYAHALKNMGLQRGQKVLMFVRPSVRFSALAFAVFRAGLVPVFIDPGMGRKNLLEAVEQIQPDALIAEPEVHILRLIFRKAFKSIKYFITTSSLTWPGLHSIYHFEKSSPTSPLMEDVKPEETAAILFTSGGTGIPKGVRYTHKIFNAQVDRLQRMFNLGEEEIDLPGFPLFSLFTITMGMKSAIPAMNPSKPAKCNPENLVANINDHQATFVAGSPAIWKRVADYCLSKNIELKSVKYLVMFGAPVSIELHQNLKKILPNGDTFTPYGATECLPVSCLSGEEVLTQYQEKMLSGNGTCVGRAVPDTVIKIAPITEDELVEENFEWLEENQLGEVCVKSDTVTPEYIGMSEKTRLAKIKAKDGSLWHRMGDLGHIDEDSQLWFCGRKGHRIELDNIVIPSIPQESHFLSLEKVGKVAFVGPKLNNTITPSLVIEPKVKLSAKDKKKMQADILSLAKEKLPHISISNVYFKDVFPVDVRHNIKIDRLKLKSEIEQGILS